MAEQVRAQLFHQLVNEINSLVEFVANLLRAAGANAARRAVGDDTSTTLEGHVVSQTNNLSEGIERIMNIMLSLQVVHLNPEIADGN